MIIGADRASRVFARQRALLRNEAMRRRVHWWLLKAPIFGRVTRGLNTARFTRTLSILTSSGVPALEALRISASVIANLPMRAAVDEAAVRVREGGAIGRSLAQSKLFPPMSVHLISSGEASGELDAMLERAANHQESEMDSLLVDDAERARAAPDRRDGPHGARDRHGDFVADLPNQSARPIAANARTRKHPFSDVCAVVHRSFAGGIAKIQFAGL